MQFSEIVFPVTIWCKVYVYKDSEGGSGDTELFCRVKTASPTPPTPAHHSHCPVGVVGMRGVYGRDSKQKLISHPECDRTFNTSLN
ncbi:hypothetical protein J6590_007422 [Homalodisca vitripennis]|nr:hypothetical protein J6590_007422 [Homalodisca vitripennis]